MANPYNCFYIPDPLKLQSLLWPRVQFWGKQVDIIYSVEENYETVVPAGNKMGKDFVAGFIALRWFLKPGTSRVITTSVKDDHLRVLWGEIGNFISTSRIPLTNDKGGPLIYNHRDIKKIIRSKVCDISYLRGMVSERGEGMAGHHAENTLAIIDEASGVDDQVRQQVEGWASRILIIGNPNPCTNFFYHAVKAGDHKAS